jgi:hypothetical protein
VAEAMSAGPESRVLPLHPCVLAEESWGGLAWLSAGENVIVARLASVGSLSSAQR